MTTAQPTINQWIMDKYNEHVIKGIYDENFIMNLPENIGEYLDKATECTSMADKALLVTEAYTLAMEQLENYRQIHPIVGKISSMRIMEYLMKLSWKFKDQIVSGEFSHVDDKLVRHFNITLAHFNVYIHDMGKKMSEGEKDYAKKYLPDLHNVLSM